MIQWLFLGIHVKHLMLQESHWGQVQDLISVSGNGVTGTKRGDVNVRKKRIETGLKSLIIYPTRTIAPVP